MKGHRSQSVRRAKVTTTVRGLVSRVGRSAGRTGRPDGANRGVVGGHGRLRDLLAHTDPGIVLTHMAVAIPDGANCLSKLVAAGAGGEALSEALADCEAVQLFYDLSFWPARDFNPNRHSCKQSCGLST